MAGMFIPWLQMMSRPAKAEENNMNPDVMSQMALQAGDGQSPQIGDQPPIPFYQLPVPQPIPSAPAMATIKPQTNPMGTLPQEIVPQQPSMMSVPQPQGAFSPEQRALLAGQLMSAVGGGHYKANPALDMALKASNKNAGDAMMRQDEALQTEKQGQLSYQTTPRDMDWRPLAALGDTWAGGGKLYEAAAAMAPESEQQKQLNNAGLLNKITASQGALTKDQIQYLGEKLKQQQYQEGRTSKADIARLNALTKMVTSPNGQMTPAQAARLGVQQQRIQIGTDKDARHTFDNDKILNQLQPRLEGATRIKEFIDAARAGKVVKNDSFLHQLNNEIGRLETGSQAVGEKTVEGMALKDSAAKLSSLVAQVTGKPEDAVRPEVIDTAEKTVNELGQSYMKGIDSRVGSLKSGMYEGQQKIVDSKHNSMINDYAKRYGGWNGQKQVKYYQGKKYELQGDRWNEAP